MMTAVWSTRGVQLSTVNCIPITGTLQCKKKVHLISDEIIFQVG